MTYGKAKSGNAKNKAYKSKTNKMGSAKSKKLPRTPPKPKGGGYK